MSKIWYFSLQVTFFALSTLVLHLLLFDFLGFYRERVYSDAYTLEDDFFHWFGVIFFDLWVGVFLGIINALSSIVLIKNAKYLGALIIATDIIWFSFCLWWYFNNRGVINVEAVSHLISPFIVGFAGGVLALLNLVTVLILNRNTNKTI